MYCADELCLFSFFIYFSFRTATGSGNRRLFVAVVTGRRRRAPTRNYADILSYRLIFRPLLSSFKNSVVYACMSIGNYVYAVFRDGRLKFSILVPYFVCNRFTSRSRSLCVRNKQIPIDEQIPIRVVNTLSFFSLGVYSNPKRR